MHATLPRLNELSFPAIKRRSLETLQVNLGYKCNQACLHCHVNAGPTRTEMMDEQTIGMVVRYLESSDVAVLDLTGGAPELNSHFRDLVTWARELGVRVMDRCNLTISEEPGQEDLATFLAANQVEIAASLPCYIEENVNRQRGEGVFEKSIRALRKLNNLGYGIVGSGLHARCQRLRHRPTRRAGVSQVASFRQPSLRKRVVRFTSRIAKKSAVLRTGCPRPPASLVRQPDRPRPTAADLHR